MSQELTSPSSTAHNHKATQTRVQIKNADMPNEMQQRAVDLGTNALKNSLTPREIAGIIKREFDRVYGPAWHCIVGKAFGSFVTHGTSLAFL